MTKLRRIILFTFMMTSASKNLVSPAEIASQIIFGSQENEQDSSHTYLKTVADVNGIDSRAALQNCKRMIFRLKSDNEFPKLNDTMRSNPFVQDDLTRQPTITNNIQITVSENGAKSGIDICKNGICNVSVSSNRHMDGNIVTDIHINVITKMETDFKTTTIPIVDGVRGVKNTYDNSLESRHFNRSHPSTYLYNNIPQIQSRYEGGEPWYQGRTTFQESNIGRYRYSGANRPIIDDKIESPFSKTPSSTDE